jgi:hypothetical protein
MHDLTDAWLLDIWEQGHSRGLVELGLIMLAGACPDAKLQDLAAIPAGRRDAMILRLRERIFGPCIVGLSTCPACGTENELTFEISDILSAVDPQGEGRPGLMTLAHMGYEAKFRLPCTYDLLAATSQPSLERAYLALIDRCITNAFRNEKEIAVPDLPEQVIDAVAEMMAEQDPAADVQMKALCSSCGRQWHQSFDIIWFFWKEIESWAQRTLRDVNDLAAAYGWSESEILSISPLRRQRYLEMVNSGRGGR